MSSNEPVSLRGPHPFLDYLSTTHITIPFFILGKSAAAVFPPTVTVNTQYRLVVLFTSLIHYTTYLYIFYFYVAYKMVSMFEKVLVFPKQVSFNSG